jgi:DNA-binding GntR family transcriptional regulator
LRQLAPAVRPGYSAWQFIFIVEDCVTRQYGSAGTKTQPGQRKTADGESTADTLAEHAVAVLHRAVVTGALAPGSKLRINELMDAYQIGATPLREALLRLTSDGLIEVNSQRGFSVAPTSRDDLEDITHTRVLIEREALRLSIERGDDNWETGIVAALYRMRKPYNGRMEGMPETEERFNDLHRSFHTALLAACHSPRLLELQRMLYDQAFRYRRLVTRGHIVHRVMLDEHQQLADAVLSRDFDKASALLEGHLQLTRVVAFPAEAAAGKPGRPTRRGPRRRSS